MNDVASASRPREHTSAARGVSEIRSAGGHAGRPATLIDLLDRLLAGGVVIQGHITLAVADIDLVDLDLGIILAATDKLAGQ